MNDSSNSYELLELALPGSWIAQHRRIWQMSFLNADKLASFGHDRGLASYNEKDIIQLWQLGLLKADFITSRRKLHLVGLVASGTDRYGKYMYSDERQLPRRLRKWNNARTNMKPLQEGVELFFHPFRYYVLYHLNRILGLNISKMQMLYQEGFSRVLDWSLSSFNRWSETEQFTESIRKWNDVASLCILTEPCLYGRIFHSIHFSPYDVENYKTGIEEIRQHIADYWDTNVRKLFHKLGSERLEEIRRDLCFDTQMLDKNRWVHTLLCLGDSKLRLELEGHLGGALFLRTMAEILRRATEEVFEKELREEDELGTGSVPYNFKKDFYGSNRLLDDTQAGGDFVRRHGLNYKPRVHVYVEGQTEYGALKYFFNSMGISVPITNLHGLVKEGNSMVTFFRDSLRGNIRDQIYSIVIIDGDVRANVRILESAARNNNASKDDGIFGRFFLARPDFEFENFEIEELEEVLWKLLGEESPTQTERELLHNHVRDTEGSKAFFDSVERFATSFPRLVGYKKGEKWGEELLEFALEHRLKQNRNRQLIEIMETAIYWEKTIQLERYDEAIKKNTVNSSGEIVQRL